MNKMWSLRATECSSAFKKKDILTRAAAWMDPEDVMPSDISQSQEDRGWTMVPLIQGAQSRQNRGDTREPGGCQQDGK